MFLRINNPIKELIVAIIVLVVGVIFLVIPSTCTSQASPPDFTEDVDQDGIQDLVDNCGLIYNPTQEDSDGNGFGNRCDFDYDNDWDIDEDDFRELESYFKGIVNHPDPNYYAPEYLDSNANNIIDWEDITNFLAACGHSSTAIITPRHIDDTEFHALCVMRCKQVMVMPLPEFGMIHGFIAGTALLFLLYTRKLGKE